MAGEPVQWRDTQWRGRVVQSDSRVGRIHLCVETTPGGYRWLVDLEDALADRAVYERGGTADSLDEAKAAAEAEVAPMLQRLAEWIGIEHLTPAIQAHQLAVEVSVLRPQPGDLFVLRLLKGQAPPMAAVAMLEHALLTVYERDGIEPTGTPDVLILGPEAELDLMSDGELTAMGFKRIPADLDATAIVEAVMRRQTNRDRQAKDDPDAG